MVCILLRMLQIPIIKCFMTTVQVVLLFLCAANYKIFYNILFH